MFFCVCVSVCFFYYSVLISFLAFSTRILTVYVFIFLCMCLNLFVSVLVSVFFCVCTSQKSYWKIVVLLNQHRK